MRIEAKNIRKQYGDNLILNLSSLIIESGEFVGMVGENGTGKSTLLHIIAGLDTNFEGSVTYDGEPLQERVQREITLVMQKPYMFSRSVRQNLAYPLAVRGLSKEEIAQRTTETAERFGLTPLMEQRADRLSGGEMQKLNLARAVIFSPRLLMLDEPTANVDRAFTEKIEESLRDYHKDNTMILVTHSAEQAHRLCDRVIRLQRGTDYEIL